MLYYIMSLFTNQRHTKSMLTRIDALEDIVETLNTNVSTISLTPGPRGEAFKIDSYGPLTTQFVSNLQTSSVDASGVTISPTNLYYYLVTQDNRIGTALTGIPDADFSRHVIMYDGTSWYDFGPFTGLSQGVPDSLEAVVTPSTADTLAIENRVTVSDSINHIFLETLSEPKITLEGTNDSTIVTNQQLTFSDTVNQNSVNISGMTISKQDAIYPIMVEVPSSNFVTRMLFGMFQHLSIIATAFRSMMLDYQTLAFQNNTYSTSINQKANYGVTNTEIDQYNNETGENTNLMLDKEGLSTTYTDGNMISQSALYKKNIIQLDYSPDGETYSQIVGSPVSGLQLRVDDYTQGTYTQTQLSNSQLSMKDETNSVIHTLTKSLLSFLNAGITLTLESTGLSSTGPLSISTGTGQTISIGSVDTSTTLHGNTTLNNLSLIAPISSSYTVTPTVGQIGYVATTILNNTDTSLRAENFAMTASTTISVAKVNLTAGTWLLIGNMNAPQFSNTGYVSLSISPTLNVINDTDNYVQHTNHANYNINLFVSQVVQITSNTTYFMNTRTNVTGQTVNLFKLKATRIA